MHWYIPLTVTFIAIFLAELGDKTQIMTISFSSRYHHLPVFMGVIMGLGVITLLGIILGTILFEFIPIYWVKILSGLIFLFFGFWTIIKMKKIEKTEIQEKRELDKKNIFSTIFVMTSLAEFGDKTQFAVIALTAQYGAPISVFIGAISAFALIVGIGVVLGKKVSEKISSKWIDIGSASVFIIIGLIFIFEAIFF